MNRERRSQFLRIWRRRRGRGELQGRIKPNPPQHPLLLRRPNLRPSGGERRKHHWSLAPAPQLPQHLLRTTWILQPRMKMGPRLSAVSGISSDRSWQLLKVALKVAPGMEVLYLGADFSTRQVESPYAASSLVGRMQSMQFKPSKKNTCICHW